jgi:hypothetical protein
MTTNTTAGIDLDGLRAEFEKLANDARFFPAELMNMRTATCNRNGKAFSLPASLSRA